MEKTVKIVKNAIQKNKNIWIYGDYDVDGITSTAVLYLSLKELGAKNVSYYIPVRDEGYGLNNDALKNQRFRWRACHYRRLWNYIFEE